MEWAEFEKEYKWVDEMIGPNLYPLTESNIKCSQWCKACWERSNDKYGFCELFLSTSDRDIKKSLSYIYLLKESLKRNDDYWLFENLKDADKIIKIFSETGMIRIGNDSFSIYLPNAKNAFKHYLVFIFHRKNKSFIKEFFTKESYRGICSGKIYLYEYEFKSTVAYEFQGKYSVYVMDNYLIFDEMDV